MPFGMFPVASTRAASSARCAASTEERKPKERSIRPMSLSMVLGMPATATFIPRSAHTFDSLYAPRCVPSPPMMYSWFTPLLRRNSIMRSISKPPRDDPSIVPP
jgi:hypothetical protein